MPQSIHYQSATITTDNGCARRKPVSERDAPMVRFISLVVGVATLMATAPIAAADGAPYCRRGEAPAFHFGFATLQAQLGAGMGDPLECAHVTGTTGQLTVQETTTGIAYYLSDVNLAAFVVMFIGKPYVHFGLAKDGLMYWRGDDAYPPDGTRVVSSDFCNAIPAATPPGDPVFNACVALYATQLGDPAASPPQAPNHLQTPATSALPPAAALPPLASGSVVDDYINGEFTGWSGDTVFRLQNGQIWQQAEYDYNYTYDYSPRVLIYPSGGGWRMQVEGMTDTIAVRRLR